MSFQGGLTASPKLDDFIASVELNLNKSMGHKAFADRMNEIIDQIMEADGDGTYANSISLLSPQLNPRAGKHNGCISHNSVG